MAEEKDEGSEDYSEDHEDHHPLASFAADTWKLTADNINIISSTFPDFSKKPKTYC